MRYDLLKNIKATDPLPQLFNQYFKGLSTQAPLRTASPNKFGDNWHPNGKSITLPTA